MQEEDKDDHSVVHRFVEELKQFECKRKASYFGERWCERYGQRFGNGDDNNKNIACAKSATGKQVMDLWQLVHNCRLPSRYSPSRIRRMLKNEMRNLTKCFKHLTRCIDMALKSERLVYNDLSRHLSALPQDWIAQRRSLADMVSTCRRFCCSANSQVLLTMTHSYFYFKHSEMAIAKIVDVDKDKRRISLELRRSVNERWEYSHHHSGNNRLQLAWVGDGDDATFVHFQHLVPFWHLDQVCTAAWYFLQDKRRLPLSVALIVAMYALRR